MTTHERTRQDFCWVMPIEGIGEVHHVSGRFRLHCSQDQPAEVTRGEWEYRYKRLGKLRLVEAPENREE